MRPRVLLLVTHLDPGGAFETVRLLARDLPEHGFEVEVAARPGGEMRSRVTAPVHSVGSLQREISPLKDARAYGEIRTLLETLRPDVVHTHSSKAGVLGRIAARRAKTAAIVHTSHGLPVDPDMSITTREVLLVAERVAARAGHRVIAVDRNTADRLLELRLARRGRLDVVPSGVDTLDLRAAPDRVTARRSLGIASDGPVVGWIGRHFRQKRPEQVVAAARRALARVPNATFVLAGDGPDIDTTRAAAADEPRIVVLGHTDDVSSVYAAINILFLASAWEGLPRTILEALSLGIPVVATNVGGISEVVRDGVNGLLAAPGDVATLSDHLVALLEDTERRAAMGRAASAALDDSFTASGMARAHARIYSELLG